MVGSQYTHHGEYHDMYCTICVLLYLHVHVHLYRLTTLHPVLKEDNRALIDALVDWLLPPTIDFVQRQVKVSIHVHVHVCTCILL